MIDDNDGGSAASRPRWYLVQARPRQAERAEINLMRQGYLIFHPRFLAERIRRGRLVKVEESLFPNYLFIRLQRWVDNWYPLRSTRGVSRLVAFGGEPLPIADELVEELRRRIGELPTEPALRAGETVRISEGAFRGLDAIFQSHHGEERVQLLIELLQREVSLTLPLSSIQRVA